MADSTFLSIGLDIGTTTSHLVISQLTVGPGEDPFCRHHLLDKKIIHRSAIHRTPLIGDDIDAASIGAIVEREYRIAGINADQILTGAVIITGETAGKRNAEAVVQQLAGQTSSFAAAVAGANQEAVLAARGSGAADWSKRHDIPVLNVDIGGGTTNFAWFDRGRLVDAAAIRVGGRHLVRRATTDSPYLATSPTAYRYLATRHPDQQLVTKWINTCVQCCEDAIFNRFDQIPEAFVITRPHHPLPESNLLFFSGGVADLMSHLDRRESPFNEFDGFDEFDDTGPILAKSLIDSPEISRAKKQFPSDPIRATVIGAGQFATSLSGETLCIDPAILPLSNVPIIAPFRFLSDITSPSSVVDGINRHRRLRDLTPQQVVAVCLPSLLSADWHRIETLAKWLSQAAMDAALPSPWVFIMADNFGKLLGEKISQVAPAQPLLVIDEINVSDADFIDLGRPVDNHRPVIPIIAKSLVFK